MTLIPRDPKEHAWWRSLSINEMKAYAKKYYPEHIWTFVCDTPSLAKEIYEKEKGVTNP
jgi:hypothetical protein